MKKKNNKKKVEMRTAIGNHFTYVNRNLKSIDRMLNSYSDNSLAEKVLVYMDTFTKFFETDLNTDEEDEQCSGADCEYPPAACEAVNEGQ